MLLRSITSPATLLLAACLVALPSVAFASAQAEGTLSGDNLSLTPASGSLQILGSWEAEAYAQVEDSTGTRDFQFDAVTGGTASAIRTGR